MLLDRALVLVLGRDEDRRRAEEAKLVVDPGVSERAQREEAVEVGDGAVECAGNGAEEAGDPAHPADQGGASRGPHPPALRRGQVVLSRGPLLRALLPGA
jgi:hypothetical protein